MDVEDNDEEESYRTMKYTDDEESCGAIEDTDDEISIGTSGVEEPVRNPGADTEEGTRRSSRYRQEPERFAADACWSCSRCDLMLAVLLVTLVTSLRYRSPGR